jgi:ferredoxin
VDVTTVLLIIVGLVVLFLFGAFSLTSLREREQRAARVAFVVAVTASLPFFLATLLPVQAQLIILILVAVVVLAGLILFLLPVGRVERGNDVPHKRVDERDIMFARARLEPGTPNYEAYYAMRPENKESDDKTRTLPGLMSVDASEANPLVFATTGAIFDQIGGLRDLVSGPPAPERKEYDAESMTEFVKGVTLHLGAHSVGIAEVQPYHVYSHIGRGPGEYGAPITLEHPYAIAFSVEMDQAMMGAAPGSPTLMESALQYANAAQIAVQLAIMIRSQGYEARAHIDGNYRVIAPLVARDAGLGEFGRMGLLMTPTLGPRVRLGVVTTDLPLVPDQRIDDTSMIDFCRVCKKCADTCPVRAIPFDDRQEIDGALRWRINHDTCFRYWNVTGTDCGVCMSLCTYSYPDSPMHNLVRWAVRRSGFARRAMVWMDGLFYGKHPTPKAAPSWVPPKIAKQRGRPSD